MKAIIFDLDDTLLWDEKSIACAFMETCKLVEGKYGIHPVVFEKEVRSIARELYSSYDTFEFTKKIGINPFEGLWGKFTDEGEGFKQLHDIAPDYQKDVWIRSLESFGIEDKEFGMLLATIFPEQRKKHPYVYEETFEILEELKERYQLLLLTNGSPSLQNTKLRLTPALVSYFEHIVISGSYGVGKPNEGLFNYLLKQADLKSTEVMMVGDNLMTDILGANRMGITSVWINHHNQEVTDVIPTYEIKRLKDIVKLVKTIENKENL